jgi:hypothetical protein
MCWLPKAIFGFSTTVLTHGTLLYVRHIQVLKVAAEIATKERKEHKDRRTKYFLCELCALSWQLQGIASQ